MTSFRIGLPSHAALRALLLLGAAACGREPSRDATVVARVGDQVLTAAALSRPFGESSRRLRAEEVRTAAELWVDFQLLARAAAAGDTLRDPALVERAMWGPTANTRAQKWYQRVSPTFARDTATPRMLYETGRIVTARQILLALPQRVTPYERTVIRARVDSLRASLTPANFGRVAARVSADSLSRAAGGQLPAWPTGRDIMVPAFEKGIQATKFGAISGVIATDFGAHIIYRPTWSEAEPLVVPAARELSRFYAESTYFNALMTARNVTFVRDVAPVARAVARAPSTYADSGTVLATMAGGDFTAAALVRWLNAFPPSEGIASQLTNAPDTLVPVVLRRIIRNELFLRQADSAGVTLTRDEQTVLDGQLRMMIASTLGTLGLDRRLVPDSAARLEASQRRAFYAQRVNAQFASILQGLAAPVQVPPPVRVLLRARYRDVTIDEPGLTRAMELARTVRQTRDSLRNNRPADSTAADSSSKRPQRAVPAPTP